METIWTIWKHWTKKPYMVVQIFRFVSCTILVRRFFVYFRCCRLVENCQILGVEIVKKTRKTQKNQGFSVLWWR